MEEASGTRSQIGGTCGSDCNLTDPSSVGQDTTNKVEGAAAADFVDGDSDRIICAVATCDEITGLTGNYSQFAFARYEESGTGDMGIMGAEDGTTGGMILGLDDATDKIEIRVGDGTDQVTCLGNDVWSINTYAYVGVSLHDETTDSIQPYFNGETDGDACDQAPMTASTDNFKISSNNSPLSYFDGQIDLSGVYDGTLVAAEHCYLCSCGPGNEFGCTYTDSSTWDDKGRNSSCGSCTMPPITTNPIGYISPSQASEFSHVWLFNDSSGPAVDLVSGGEDLAWNGTPTQDTTNYVEGGSSIDFDSSVYLDCTGACPSTIAATGSITFGAYYWLDDETVTKDIWDSGSTTDGFRLLARGAQADDHFRLMIGDTTATNIDSTTDYAVNTWYQVVGKFDDVADEMEIFVNGASENTSSSQTSMDTNGNDILLPYFNATNVKMDVAFIYSGVLSDAEVCYLCSAGGPANGAGMTHDGTSFVSLGLNSSQCGSCSLTGIDPENPIHAGPTCAGDIEEEYFNGTGYEQSWTEDITCTGTMDEDDTTRVENFFAAESLQATTTVGAAGCATRARNEFTETDPAYYAASFYIDTEGLADGEEVVLMSLGKNVSSDRFVCAVAQQNSGTLELTLWRAANGVTVDCQNTDSSTKADTYGTLDLDTVYLVEIYYEENSSTDGFGWWVWDCGANGWECDPDPDYSWTSTADINSTSPSRVYIGHTVVGSASTTLDAYYGFAHVSSERVCQ
jgi:hypothetical protein